MRAAGRRFNTWMITGTALLLALGVMLPLVFHAFPLGGRIFLPMHIPTFIAGLVLGPLSGLIVGAGSPVLSALVTGRPPIYYMVPMIFELATYGVVAGLLRPVLERAFRRRARGAASAQGRAATARTGRAPGSYWTPCLVTSLVVAMVAGRIVWLAVVVWLAPLIGISARTVAMAIAAIGAGWVGMAIQIALIPPIVRAIERVRNP
jgi:niacin transporter